MKLSTISGGFQNINHSFYPISEATFLQAIFHQLSFLFQSQDPWRSRNRGKLHLHIQMRFTETIPPLSETQSTGLRRPLPASERAARWHSELLINSKLQQLVLCKLFCFVLISNPQMHISRSNFSLNITMFFL